MNFIDFKRKYQKQPPVHHPSKAVPAPLVSIFVQTYNHEKYIGKCLESIIAQKVNFPYEILLGEDDSSDNTRKICLDYANRHPEKIRLFLHHSENKIQLGSLVTGNFNIFYNFYKANGKYIAFCDGDDYWEDPFKLQKQILFLEENPDYISAYHLFKIDSKSIIHRDKFFNDQPSHDISAQQLQKLEYHPHISTICVKRVLPDPPEQIMEVINIDSFLISVIGNYGKMKFMQDIRPSVYRRHKEGMWTKKNKIFKFRYKALIYQKLYEYYSILGKNKLATFYKKELRNIHKMEITFYLKNLNFINAIKLFKELTIKNLNKDI